MKKLSLDILRASTLGLPSDEETVKLAIETLCNVGLFSMGAEFRLKLVDVILQSNTAFDHLRLVRIPSRFLSVYENEIDNMDLPVTSPIAQAIFERGLKTLVD